MKYRILEKNHYFYPQFETSVGWNFFTEPHSVYDISLVYFTNKEKAESFLNSEVKRNKFAKEIIHAYETKN